MSDETILAEALANNPVESAIPLEPKVRRLLPVFERRPPTVFDSTATTGYKRCPRYFFFRYVLGFKTAIEENQVALDWGSAMHKYAEIYLREGNHTKGVAAAMMKHREPDPDKPREKFLTLSRLQSTCDELKIFIDQITSRPSYKMIGVEQPWNFRLMDGTPIGGRFDWIYQMGSELHIVDFKTTTVHKSYWPLSIDPNDQAKRYLYAAVALHGKPVPLDYVVIYNMASKAKPEIYVHQLTKSRSTLVKWMEGQLFWYKMMRESFLTDSWPENEKSCYRCRFAPVCRAPSEGAQENLLRERYIKSFWDFNKADQEEEV
jgi:hypothetical protein